MKYLLILFAFFLTSCSTDEDIVMVRYSVSASSYPLHVEYVEQGILYIDTIDSKNWAKSHRAATGEQVQVKGLSLSSAGSMRVTIHFDGENVKSLYTDGHSDNGMEVAAVVE